MKRNRNDNGKARESQQIRCAIYTRKSTEEGLDQEFNSLDAQREAAEAFIASQQHEGWVGLPERYDDGGFTGANMERPALKRLFEDIEAGGIDCVVVYKVDRLSRSLLDFARMMGSFEKYQVSFVSVTQQFNTTHSMGRLTLNILLSFAQFEREIISERTRDKIAAARRRGKWVGGMPVLGYDVDPRGSKLVVNAEEADRVRAIFDEYLQMQSLIRTVKALNEREWTTKRWTTRKGHERGGRPFDKTSLFRLLSNVGYRGKVRYKDEVHAGEHEAMSLFQAAPQEHLALAKHLTAETKAEEFVAGKGVVTKWVRLRRQNHWLDALYTACAAGHFCGVRLVEDDAPARPRPRPRPSTRPAGEPWIDVERCRETFNRWMREGW